MKKLSLYILSLLAIQISYAVSPSSLIVNPNGGTYRINIGYELIVDTTIISRPRDTTILRLDIPLSPDKVLNFETESYAGYLDQTDRISHVEVISAHIIDITFSANNSDSTINGQFIVFVDVATTGKLGTFVLQQDHVVTFTQDKSVPTPPEETTDIFEWIGPCDVSDDISNRIMLQNIRSVFKKTYSDISQKGIAPKYIGTVTYYDAMGSDVQVVEVGSTPLKRDLISHKTYNPLHLDEPLCSYLPYSVAENNGLYDSKAPLSQSNFYRRYYGVGALYGYVENSFDLTPTTYVIKKTNPGMDSKYSNAYGYDVIHDDGAPTLYQTTHYDADGLSRITYTDHFGKVIKESIHRTIITPSSISHMYMYDQYFEYDDRDQLCKVTSAMENSSEDYTYTYEYDKKGRIITRKLPGCQKETYAYNDADQIVNRTRGAYKIMSSYDPFGRLTKERLEYTLNDTDYSVNDIRICQYDAMPSGIESLSFTPVESIVSEINCDNRTKGLKTYEKIAIADSLQYQTSPKFIERAFYYDYKCRIIQTVERNHLGGISRMSNKYDFLGNILVSHESHQRSATSIPDIIVTNFTYDHRSRLITESTVLNGGTPAIVTYGYNELGQLASRTYGTGAHAVVDSVKYNIQGWITEQNNNKFGMKLRYNNPMYGDTKPSYTGNITEWEWQHKDALQGDTPVNTYAFSYDNLNRLSDTKQYVNSVATDQFVEKDLSYDKNGNILALKRYDAGALLDDYTYVYRGNQLTTLKNAETDVYTYTYDADGNMTHDGRRGIDLKYNFLNLVSKVSANDIIKANYSYLADGIKVGVVDADGRGFEYLGSLVYERNGANLALESAAFGGGRIVASETETGETYEPNYFLTDHLGSVRVIVGADGRAKERNNYYALGERWSPDGSAAVNRYQFSCKELQTTGEVGYLDFGARMYDGKVGRWITMDPMAEKYPSISPCVFCAENPENRVDPDGR